MELSDRRPASAATAAAVTRPAVAEHPDLPVVGPLTGTWTWDVAGDRWWWSDEVYAIHGLAPGEVVPTTELLLAHKVLDDLERCRSVLAGARVRPGRFSDLHRIVDTRRRTRHVLAVGDGRAGPDGRVLEVSGYLVDLTDTRRAAMQPALEEALGHALEHRSVIDLAKGGIMGAHGVDAATRVDVLLQGERPTRNVTGPPLGCTRG